MEFVHERSYGFIKRTVNVIDGPVMPHPSSSTGKRISVRGVSLTFELKGDEWVIGSWTQVSFHGPVLRKDGSPGKETWGGSVHYAWDKMPEYDWLRQLIEGARPEGAPALPFRLAGLEASDELQA